MNSNILKYNSQTDFSFQKYEFYNSYFYPKIRVVCLLSLQLAFLSKNTSCVFAEIYNSYFYPKIRVMCWQRFTTRIFEVKIRVVNIGKRTTRIFEVKIWVVNLSKRTTRIFEVKIRVVNLCKRTTCIFERKSLFENYTSKCLNSCPIWDKNTGSPQSFYLQAKFTNRLWFCILMTGV